MSLSIPISGLNPLSVVTSSDFIPIVQSSSMLTTYRTPLSVVATWISTSVAALSAFSSVSSSHSNVSDHSSTSDLATLSINTSNLIYPNTSTALHATSADYATNAGTAVTASYALSMITGSSIPSSSYSFYSQTSLSASFASRSFFATSASYASSLISASWASRSLVATSASFASRSISSSYSTVSTTASYSLGNMIRAFGTVLMKTANDYNSIIISSASFNVKPTVILGGSGAGAIIDPDTWSPPMGLGVNTLHVNLPGNAIYISFINPMPTRYYTVLCTYNGYEPYGYETITTWTSPVGQTLTGFTMSFSGGDNTSTEGKFITNFMILHP